MITSDRSIVPTERAEDVVMTRAIMPPKEWGLYSLCIMQVCAHSGVPPEQVERRANELNPTGLQSGSRWRIVWGTDENDPANNANKAPIRCVEQPGRIHYLLSC